MRISPPIAANANVDVFYFTDLAITPPNTEIDYKYSSELASGGLVGYKFFNSNETIYIRDQLGRRVFKANSNTSFIVSADMTTQNQWVSPAIDISNGLSVFGIEFLINNGELSNNNIVINNGGTGYLITDNSNLTISITGGGGSGATAVVNSISNGAVTSITLTNPGTGYYTTPNIAITFSGNATMRAANTNVSATIIGETSTHGGNALARYITKKIKLADGLDASDLRVYLTAYKPAGTQIFVYYKVLSAEDSDVFDNKQWNVMTQIGNSLVTSKTTADMIEFTFAPGTNGTPDIFLGRKIQKACLIKIFSSLYPLLLIVALRRVCANALVD